MPTGPLDGWLWARAVKQGDGGATSTSGGAIQYAAAKINGVPSGGLERPKTYKEWLKWLGWNATDVRHARLLGVMDELGLWDEFMQESHKRREAGERARDRAAARAVLRRRSTGDGH